MTSKCHPPCTYVAASNICSRSALVCSLSGCFLSVGQHFTLEARSSASAVPERHPHIVSTSFGFTNGELLAPARQPPASELTQRRGSARVTCGSSSLASALAHHQRQRKRSSAIALRHQRRASNSSGSSLQRPRSFSKSAAATAAARR